VSKQTIEYQVTVTVEAGPWADDHDTAIVGAALGDAVEDLGWPGVSAQVQPL